MSGAPDPEGGPPRRRIRPWLLGVVSVLAVWAALLLPDSVGALMPAAFLRLPVEGILLAALLLVLPGRVVRPAAGVLGLVLGVLTVGKVLDAAVGAGLGRPFDPVSDLGQLGSGAGVVADALGTTPTIVIVGASVLAVLVLALLVAAALRLARVLRAAPRRSGRVLLALALIWVLTAALGVRIVPGEPTASVDEAGFATGEVTRALASAAAVRSFGIELGKPDPYARTSPTLQLAKLRGKDVLVVFVESYGEVAVRGSALSRGVDATLGAGTRRLAAAGFSARTAMLTSPTFGGISWLAHSTLQSGVWVPNQASYERLLTTNRLTLTREFHRAGWRTVSDIPSDVHAWPQGRRFYDYDQMVDGLDVAYRGPQFGYARIPDQYTLSTFAQRELTPGHAPLMAEIDLVSSHTPWTPLPRLVPPGSLGDGSVYGPMATGGVPPDIAWQNPERVRALYGRSIRYSLECLFDFITRSHDKNLVVLMLGDHQPSEIVSGSGAGHDVPVSLISADPAVLKAIDGWHWASGLLPASSGPVWRMDRFRDRFFDAYAR